MIFKTLSRPPPHTQAHDSLFATELQKYDGLVVDIKQNAEAQAELLKRLEQDNKVPAAAGEGGGL